MSKAQKPYATNPEQARSLDAAQASAKTAAAAEGVSAEIVERFKQGDMAAFRHIYSKYRQRIFSYCLYCTGDQVIAEDAFQEAFTRAYTRREQLKEPKALKSWLLLITRSVCLNMLRTSKFTPDFVSLDVPDSHTGERREYAELSHEPMEGHLSEDMLRHALQQLQPIHRDAFLLREFEGYSYEEIATMTQASVMNVKVRITRAKKQLRAILAPYYSIKLQKREQQRSHGTTPDVPPQDADDLPADPDHSDTGHEQAWMLEKGVFAR